MDWILRIAERIASSILSTYFIRLFDLIKAKICNHVKEKDK